MASVEALEKRFVEAEEDIKSLYGQFCILHEFFRHKFGEEFAEFAKNYVHSSGSHRLTKDKADGDNDNNNEEGNVSAPEPEDPLGDSEIQIVEGEDGVIVMVNSQNSEQEYFDEKEVDVFANNNMQLCLPCDSATTSTPTTTDFDRNQLELVSSRLQIADPRSYSRRGNIMFDLVSDSDSDSESRKAPPRQRPPPPRARPPPPRVMICKFCKSDFKGKPQPVEAFVSHLGLKESLNCMFCAERFGCEQGWLAHCKRVHSERFAAENPECHLCNKGFGTRAKIINHLLTHSEEKIFMCRMCHQTYRTSRSLFAHLTKEEIESPKPKKVKGSHQNTRAKCEVCIQDYPAVMESLEAHN